MSYETHNIQQGTTEWHAHRANTYNASDAGTALGINPYKARQELIRELATGATKEIDAATQRRFDDGHRFEALARCIAEQIVGDDLAPTTVSAAFRNLTRKLSASLDGTTFGSGENWEHKTLSESLAAALDRGEIPEQYHPQMEQGMMINGAHHCLFMASKWDDNDQLIEEKHLWYESRPELRAKIIAAWQQVESDLAGYQHVEAAPVAVAAPINELPALMVEITGSVTASNLEQWRDVVTARIAAINTDLQTDNDFADADAMVKFLDDGEKRIDLVKSQAQANAADIDRVFRALDEIKASMRAKRLELDKLVSKRKESIKIEIMQAGKDELAKHIAGLNKRLGKVQMPAIAADFATAIKGKRNLESMRSAVSDLVAAKKIESNEIADRIQENLALLDGAKEHNFLFSDLSALVMKAPDDLALVIKSRIADHEAAEAKRLEAEREKIRVEEEAKAAAKVKAEQDEAERQRKAAEEAAAKIERDRVAGASKVISNTEPATQEKPADADPGMGRPTPAVAAHTGITGSARLLDRLDDLARQMTERELSDLCIHAAHILEARKVAA